MKLISKKIQEIYDKAIKEWETNPKKDGYAFYDICDYDFIQYYLDDKEIHEILNETDLETMSEWINDYLDFTDNEPDTYILEHAIIQHIKDLIMFKYHKNGGK